MRIISKARDVYDLQNSMFDPNRVWVRERKEIRIPITLDGGLVQQKTLYTKNMGGASTYTAQPLFLAGEVYWIHKVTDHISNRDTLVTLDKEILKEYLEANGLSLRLFGKDNSIDKALTKVIEYTDSVKAKLESIREPICMPVDIEVNPADGTKHVKILLNFSLFDEDIPWKEIDSNLYRLHQTLESYIFGVLSGFTPEVGELSDIDRLIAKGFDVKTSFRRARR